MSSALSEQLIYPRPGAHAMSWPPTTRSHFNHRERNWSLFEYMEVFYNRQRRHPAIHYETPLAFEAANNP